MSRALNRREFIRHILTLSATGAALELGGCAPKPTATPPPAAAQAGPLAPSTPFAGPALARATDTPTRPNAPTSTSAVAPAAATGAPPQATATSPTVAAEAAYLAVARGAGADPAELTRRAIAAVGGIERFVKPGADVVVKPNICNAYYGPEYASTTNPAVVGAIIALCLAAGAKRVRVMDYPFGGSAQNAYAKSGIGAAVAAAGGEMVVMNRLRYREVAIPQGKTIKKWQVYGDILDADVVINAPIAKDHGSTRLTLGMKNLMGVIEDRGGFHARGLDQCIADLNSVVRSQLTVVDAVRILLANGPTGGNLNDVKPAGTVIASADVVAADAYAATLFGLTAADIGYIRLGGEMGLGRVDLDGVKVEEIGV